MDLLELNEKMSMVFRVEFAKAVTFTQVDEIELGTSEAKVRYQPVHPAVLEIKRAVYVVVFGGENAVYVGSFTRTLAKRWLYVRDGYVYHHMRRHIAEQLSVGGSASLWLVQEGQLQECIPEPLRQYVNVQGVEANLRYLYDFEYNFIE